MVAVGDSTEVYVYDISVAGGYKNIATYNGMMVLTQLTAHKLLADNKTHVVLSDNRGQLLLRLEPVIRQVCSSQPGWIC